LSFLFIPWELGQVPYIVGKVLEMDIYPNTFHVHLSKSPIDEIPSNIDYSTIASAP